jgi:hypothetical protein
MRSLTEEATAEVQAVIDANRDRLSAVRNLLGAEPGFPVAGGWCVSLP